MEFDEIGEKYSNHYYFNGNSNPNMASSSLYSNKRQIGEQFSTWYRQFRAKIYCFLEQSNNDVFGFIYHVGVFAYIILVFFLSALADLGREIPNLINKMEMSLAIYFSVEFFIRFWAAGANAKFQGFSGRLKYLKRPICLLDIFILCGSLYIVEIFVFQPQQYDPNYQINVKNFNSGQPQNPSTDVSIPTRRDTLADFLRFMQIFRLFHIDRQMTTWKLVRRMVQRSRFELLAAYYITFMVFVTLAVLVYTIESEDWDWQNTKNYSNESSTNSSDQTTRTFKTFGDAFWFSIVSLLTIGYGDIVPQQWPSKVVVCIFSYFGMSLFSAASGLVGIGMSLMLHNQNKEKKHVKVRDLAARLIQSWYRFHLISNDSTFVSIPAFRKYCAKLQQAERRILRGRAITHKLLERKSKLAKALTRPQFFVQERKSLDNPEQSSEIFTSLIRSGAMAIPEKISIPEHLTTNETIRPSTLPPLPHSITHRLGNPIVTSPSAKINLRNAAILNAATATASSNSISENSGRMSPLALITDRRGTLPNINSSTMKMPDLKGKTDFIKKRANSVPISSPDSTSLDEENSKNERKAEDDEYVEEEAEDTVLNYFSNYSFFRSQSASLSQRSEDTTSYCVLDESKIIHYRAILRMIYFFTFLTVRSRFKRAREPFEIGDAQTELCDMEYQRAQKFKELEIRIEATLGESKRSSLLDPRSFSNITANSQQEHQQNAYIKRPDSETKEQHSLQERLEIIETKSNELESKLDEIERLAQSILQNMQISSSLS